MTPELVNLINQITMLEDFGLGIIGVVKLSPNGARRNESVCEEGLAGLGSCKGYHRSEKVRICDIREEIQY